MLTNGESSKESSNEIQINNEDKTTAEECAAEISSTNCEKSSNEMDEKSANDIDEKSSNDNGEKSVNDNYNVDTDNVNESEVTEDAEVDFHATLVKVWADISKELEVSPQSLNRFPKFQSTASARVSLPDSLDKRSPKFYQRKRGQ